MSGFRNGMIAAALAKIDTPVATTGTILFKAPVSAVDDGTRYYASIYPVNSAGNNGNPVSPMLGLSTAIESNVGRYWVCITSSRYIDEVNTQKYANRADINGVTTTAVIGFEEYRNGFFIDVVAGETVTIDNMNFVAY